MTGAQWLHVFIDVPPDQAEVSGRFWSAALGWPLGEPWPDHPEFRDSCRRTAPYLHQQVGDHDPRVHLDLEVADKGAAAERLIALGAAPARPPRARRQWCPPGVPLLPRDAPGAGTDRLPLSWPGGRTGLVQVCLHFPAITTSARSRSRAPRWTRARRTAAPNSPAALPPTAPPSSCCSAAARRRPGRTVPAHIDLGPIASGRCRAAAGAGAEQIGTGAAGSRCTIPSA